MQEIFISYSSKDQQCADEIVAYLEERGFSCFIAHRDIKAGESYDMRLIDAIDRAKLLVLVFSDNSDMSKHVKSEIAMAFDNETTIIPYKITGSKPTQLKYYLQTAHWLDATAPTTNHLEDLCSRIAEIIQPSDNKQKVVMAVSQLLTEQGFQFEIADVIDAPCYTTVTVQLTNTQIHQGILQRKLMMLERDARYKLNTPARVYRENNGILGDLVYKYVFEITHDKTISFDMQQALAKTPELKDMQLPIVVGMDYDGSVVCKDLHDTATVSVCGGEGSGKRNFIYNMIHSIISVRSPQEVNFTIFGDKTCYQFLENSPYLAFEIKPSGYDIFEKIEQIAVRRLAKTQQKPIDAYNANATEKIPHLVVVCEDAELNYDILRRFFDNTTNKILWQASGIHIVVSSEHRNSLSPYTFDTTIYHAIPSENYMSHNAYILSYATGDIIYEDGDGRILRRLLSPYVSEQYMQEVSVQKQNLARSSHKDTFDE